MRRRFPAIVMLAISPVASAQLRFGGNLDLAKYSSPSGAYVLEVDPTAPTGSGSADCRLTRMGTEVWATKLPFTFRDAALTDDGVACGHALSEGSTFRGDFIVAIVDAKGDVRLEWKTRCRGSWGPDQPGNPQAVGMVFEPHLDSFAVRIADVDNSNREAWWTFAISTGERLPDVWPDETLTKHAEVSFWLLSVRPLPDLGLRVLHWRHFCWSRRELGAVFSVIDSQARVVWTRSLPHDYRIPDDEKAEDQLERQIRTTGAILSTGSGGRFALWFVAEKARVEFEARPDEKAETGWSVAETGRTPYVPESPPIQEPEPLWELSLEHAGSYVLERPAATPSLFTDLETWDFASNCDFLAIDQVAKRSFVFRRLDANGDVVIEKPIDAFVEESDHVDRWARVSDREWLVAVRNDEEVSTRLRRVNLETGAVEDEADAIELAAGGVAPHVGGLAIMADGGCAALLAYHYQYTIGEMLAAFDADGNRRFFVPEQYEDKTKLFGPEDVAIAPNGDVVVLENSANDLKVYAADGEYLRTIEFEKEFGKKANYPTDLRIGANGDILVVDFDGDPPLWRLAPDGTLRSRVVPRTAGGRFDDDVVDDSRIAPYGMIWTTDGRAFLALGDDGMVEKVVGVAPDATVLDEPGAMSIDSAGRCLVLDKRTGSIHVFDRDGSRAFVACPDPAERIAQKWNERIVSDARGGVLARLEFEIGEPSPGYVRFDATGRRVGVVPIEEDVLATCADGRFWTAASILDPGLVLQDEHGTRHRRIERYPDRRWMPQACSATIDPDGVLIGVLPRSLLYVERGERDADGVLVVPLPRTKFYKTECAATREWVVLWSDYHDAPVLHRRADGKSYSWTPPATAEDSKWTYGFSPDGRELLALESPALIVHRFLLSSP